MAWLTLTVSNPGGDAYSTSFVDYPINALVPSPEVALWPPNTEQRIAAFMSSEEEEPIVYSPEEPNAGTIQTIGGPDQPAAYFTPDAEGIYHVIASAQSNQNHNTKITVTISDHAGRSHWTIQPTGFPGNSQSQTVTLLPDGKVLIVGGFSCPDPYCSKATILDTIETYDPSSRTFTLIGHLASPRQFHNATLLTDGTVLITGGYVTDQTKLLSTAEVIDPSTGISTKVGNFATTRQGYTITALPKGKALVAGGQSGSSMLKSTELYGAKTRVFSPGPAMSFFRSYHTATALANGKVVLAGGNGNTIEVYDPQTNTFSTVGRLADLRTAHSAVLLDDGRILFAHGINNWYGSSGGDVIGSVEMLAYSEFFDPAKVQIPTDPKVQTTTLGPQMQYGRINIGFALNPPALLNNGTVLYGSMGMGAEIFSPITNSFTATSSFSESPVALPDGTAIGIDPSVPYGVLTYYPDGSVLPNNPVPVLTSVFPPEAPVNGYGAVTVRGTGFANGACITLDGVPLITSVIFGTELTADLPQQPTAGVHQVAVTNPSPGGGTSNSLQIIADAYVTVSPAGDGLHPGGSKQFTATVVGSTNQTIAWSVKEGSAGGSITSSGLYTAPSATGIYHVTAASPLHSSPSTRVPVIVANSSYFSESGTLNTRRSGHTASLLPSGKVLILGGTVGPGAADAQAEVYDPAASSFTVLPAPISNPKTLQKLDPRSFGTATELQDGRILISAGELRTGSSWPSILYDPAANTFSETGPLRTNRTNETATLLRNGKVLVAGGTSPDLQPIASTELYDPATGKFSASGTMTVARSGHTATLLSSGKVLITGGQSLTGIAASAEIYDPASGTFSPVGPMNAARWLHTATLLPGGKVLIANCGNLDVYDPATQKFTAIGSTDLHTQSGTAVLLQSGKVLIAADGQAELVDSTTLSVSATNPPIEQRRNATATLLPDGTVLFVGGSLPTGEVLQSSEIYHP